MFRPQIGNQLSKITCRLQSTKASTERVGIISVPFYKGQPKPGVDKGPKVIRESEFLKSIGGISENIEITDYGDITYKRDELVCGKNMKNCEEVFGCNKSLFNTMHTALQETDKVITLGGDHSIGIGSVLGHAMHDPNVALIWVDAHADINLNETSDTGNVHGMPVSFIVEELQRFVPKVDWIKNRIPAKRIAYIGLRSVDPYESTILQSLGICAFSMDRVEKYGIRKVLKMVSQTIDPCGKANYHISFDVDGMDPSETPSTGTPVRGGLTLREGITIVEHFNKTNRLTAMDIVEFNPEIGSQEDVARTLGAVHEIGRAAVGNKRSGNAKTLEQLEEILKKIAQ